MLGFFKKKPAAEAVSVSYHLSIPSGPSEFTHDEPMAADQYKGFNNSYYTAAHDGEKYEGGLGPIPLLYTDYYALRARSSAFFKTNLYARGLIRRLVTNIINTGLTLEADPVAAQLPISEEAAAAWSTDVENNFEAWGSLADVCDFQKNYTFAQMQKVAYREALIEGDQLILEHFNQKTLLPSYEIINASNVETPLQADDLAKTGNTIEMGVELDKNRRHVAYWVTQSDLTSKRIPAYGRKGRRMSWLYYATDKRHDEVRGEPLLALVMQSVGEIDRYRDSAQRKASINALFAMFMYQSPGAKGQSTRPLTGGASRRVVGERETGSGEAYKTNFAEHGNGTTFDQLPQGMEPKAFTAAGTDEKFGDFETAIFNGVCWALEIPPSVAKMIFGNSYSASRGEVKEFELVINSKRAEIADGFTRPVYRAWLVAMALTRQIKAAGFLESTRSAREFKTFAAWTNSNWIGAVKEAVDLPKEVAGHNLLVASGYSTHRAASRRLTGSDFQTNIARVAKENQQKADAMRPLLELQKEYGPEIVDKVEQIATAQLYAIGDIDQ